MCLCFHFFEDDSLDCGSGSSLVCLLAAASEKGEVLVQIPVWFVFFSFALKREIVVQVLVWFAFPQKKKAKPVQNQHQTVVVVVVLVLSSFGPHRR